MSSFDTIPHGELIECVARRISDKHVLALIKAWLKAPVEESTGRGASGSSAARDRGMARHKAASSRPCSPTST